MMVRRGERIIEGVDVQISKIEQLLTPSPTVSDKDSADLCQKIRYLIDKTEALLAQADIKLSALKAVGTETPRTLSNIYDQIAAVQPRNLTQISGTALTGRDWSGDLAKLQNLDLTLSALRDALRKSTIDTTVYEKTLADVWYYLTLIKAKTDNLDVLLSTRATESTLTSIKNALASVATDKLRVSPVDALPESPFNLSKVGGTALTGRDWSGDLAKLQNLDLALSVLAGVQRWGRNVSPTWVHAAEVTAPAAGTALVSKTVSTGKSGYIYGFFISSGEANDFKVNWTSGAAAYSKRIVLGGKGTVQYADFIAFNEGLPADAGTSVTITNVNAGSTGIVYQAAILYAEV